MSDYDDTPANKQEAMEEDVERARVIAQAIDWKMETASINRKEGDTSGGEWWQKKADKEAEEIGNLYDRRQELLESGDPEMQTDNPDKSLVMSEASKVVDKDFYEPEALRELRYWDKSRNAALRAAKKFDEVGSLEAYRVWQETEQQLSERRSYSYGRSK